MAAPAFYSDSALTTVATTVIARQRSDGTSAPVKVRLWIGSTAAGWKHRVAANPGVDTIQISVTDTTTGSGHATTEVKLALTEAGLATATAGALLDIGATQILSEAVNAVSFWVEINDATHVVGTATELGLITNELATDPV